jgi:hypothetical protein
MATDVIRYDLLVQEALRSVVRKVLSDAARDGLPGEHHFYITFKTHAPGVQLSARMRNQYPTEMTIILQHQFWGLNVLEQGFEVGLSFQKIPETLFIPFDALTGFFDPSVQFGLKFETEIGANDVDGPLGATAQAAESSHGLSVAASDGEKVAGGGSLEVLSRGDEGAALPPRTEEAKVISIDAFRKKP